MPNWAWWSCVSIRYGNLSHVRDYAPGKVRIEFFTRYETFLWDSWLRNTAWGMKVQEKKKLPELWIGCTIMLFNLIQSQGSVISIISHITITCKNHRWRHKTTTVSLRRAWGLLAPPVAEVSTRLYLTYHKPSPSPHHNLRWPQAICILEKHNLHEHLPIDGVRKNPSQNWGKSCFPRLCNNINNQTIGTE